MDAFREKIGHFGIPGSNFRGGKRFSFFPWYDIIVTIHQVIFPKIPFSQQIERKVRVMRIIWNGHSCFTLESAGGTVVVDPYLDGSVPGLAPLRLQADAVYCSHGHRDHGGTEVVALSGDTPEMAVETLNTWHDDQQGAQRGPNVIHIFQTEGLRVAHLGDLGCELEPEQLEALKGLDALMIPVGGFYTIDAKQAKALTDLLQPRVTIPMHYRSSTFGYDVIAPLEDYLSLCGDVVRYPGNTLVLSKDTPKQTAVLTYVPQE